MRRRATALDRVLLALDRRLVPAVVRALDRARDLGPVSARDLPRERELARDLARELELSRDLGQELEYARAGNAFELAGALELVRELEGALIRDREPARADALEGARASALEREFEHEYQLDVVFVRAPAFVRARAKVRVLNRVRALARALVCTRDFAAAYEDEPAVGGGARVMLTLMALAVQVLPVARQPRHLEEFCAELLELRWWQWPWHALCIVSCSVGLRRALNKSASAHRTQR